MKQRFENWCSNKNLYTDLHSSILFITVKRWKQSERPSNNEWIRKMDDICIIEYYTTIKKNKGLIHTTAWMKLENIMLSERSQTQTVTYYMILFL